MCIQSANLEVEGREKAKEKGGFPMQMYKKKEKKCKSDRDDLKII
jgi:hypothetical protein